MKLSNKFKKTVLCIAAAIVLSGCSSSNDDSKLVDTPNTAPTAESSTVSIDEDTTKAIQLLVDDAEGEQLIFTIVDLPEHGTLEEVSDSYVKYTPSADYSGDDAFTFQVNDGEFDSSVAMVSISVVARNDRAITQAVAVALDEDTSVDVGLIASDIDGDTLTYRVAGMPKHGTVSAVEGNSVTYTPDADYFGEDAFGFIANDGKRDSEASTVTVTVIPINDEPVPTRLYSTTNQDTSVEIQMIATDADSDALSYEVVSQPTSGSLSVVSGNVVVYTPGNLHVSSDTFVYVANDGQVDSRNARVTVTIVSVTDTPENPTATINGDNIVFSWSAVEGADSYAVCYAQQTITDMAECESLYEGQYFSAYEESSLTVEQVEKGRPYFFRVAAINSDGFVGEMSDEAVATVKIAVNDSGALFYVDNQHGRDVTDSDDSDGALGFSFTKLSVDGVELAADASDWSCVKDNVTGLVWENKTSSGGLNDRDDKYTWYSTDSRNNGGNAGDMGVADTCDGYTESSTETFCNTQNFAERVNAAGLCGRDSWRLPTPDELLSIVMVSSESLVDLDYFPNQQTYLGVAQTGGLKYWTSAPAMDASKAWSTGFSKADIYFNSGYYSDTSNKTSALYVRLVSSR